jgi:hypothetical protein
MDGIDTVFLVRIAPAAAVDAALARIARHARRIVFLSAEDAASLFQQPNPASVAVRALCEEAHGGPEYRQARCASKR